MHKNASECVESSEQWIETCLKWGIMRSNEKTRFSSKSYRLNGVFFLNFFHGHLQKK